jgi:molybdopterin molybdotransferase
MNAIATFSCETSGLPRVEEALGLMLRHCPPPAGIEQVPLVAAPGRILAEGAHALATVPPCDRSAMDGYAFRFGADTPLHLVGAAPAGAPHIGSIAAGECIAISTGGALPAGCDTVALREHCAITANGIQVIAKGPGANVRRRGEDFHLGDLLLSAGTRLTSRHIALLAAAGIRHLCVRPSLQIAVLSVGDELLDTSADAIHDANRPMLSALCAVRGHCVSDFGIIADNRVQLTKALTAAAQHHDVILLSAGTSAGDGDHVHDALLDCGGQLLVSGVAIRPGKPVSFGRIGSALVIALPGNPAAAYVTLLALGLPLLRHLAGETPSPSPWQRVKATFSHRKKAGLREYLRARSTRGADGAFQIQACRDNGPAMLSSLADADGLVMLAEDETGFAAGDAVLFASFQDLEAL